MTAKRVLCVLATVLAVSTPDLAATPQSRSTAEARRAARERAKAAAKAKAMERTRATAGSMKLTGPNGTLHVEAGSSPQTLSYAVRGGTAPVRITFAYRRRSSGSRPGFADPRTRSTRFGSAAVSRRPTVMPKGVTSIQLAALQADERRRLEAPVRRSLRLIPPPRHTPSTANYDALTVTATDGTGKRKTLTLRVQITVTPRSGPTRYFDRFEVDAASFTWRNCALAAAFCSLTNLPDYEVREHLRPFGFDAGKLRYTGNPARGTRGIAVSNDHMVLFAFRETDTAHAAAVFRVLQAITVRASPSYARARNADVHMGFKDAVDVDFWRQITDYVREFGTDPRGRPKKIWLTGFSFGSALATLTAARLLRNGHRVQGVYAFGPPNVGNDAFKADYNRAVGGRHYRVINQADSVPRFPPWPFVAVGHLRYIDHLPPHSMRPRSDTDVHMVTHYAAQYLLHGGVSTGYWLLLMRHHDLEDYCGFIRQNAMRNGVLESHLPPVQGG